MARVLVRLKLALLRAGLASAGIQGRLGAAFALFVAAAVGGTGAAGLFLLRLLAGRDATDAACAAMAFILVVWVLGPIVAAGADGTLDPERLAPFPLTRRQLIPGLLLAGLVGFGGVVTVLLLLGVLVGMTPASPLAVLSVLAVACHLLLCAGLSRFVATLISGATRSRRWRDVALLAGPVFALVLNVGFQVLSRSLSSRGALASGPGDRLDGARLAARVLGGPSALAVGLAREGRALAALACLAGGVALLAIVVVGWGAALERVMTSAGTGGHRSGRPARPLRPRLVPFLPAGRTGAVAAKDLRLTWRDPRQRVALFGMVFAAVAPIVSLRVFSSTSPRMLLAAAIPAFVLGTQSTNQFGFDGPAHWLSVATGDDPLPELVGKNLTRLLLAIPFVVVALVGLAFRGASIDFLLPALGLSAAGFGLAMGMGNWFSVTAAVPLPDTASNVFSAGNSGQGLAAAGPALAVLFGGALLLAPLAAALILVDSRPLLQVLGVAGAAAGIGGWRLGTGAAVRRLRPRQPELLATLSART